MVRSKIFQFFIRFSNAVLIQRVLKVKGLNDARVVVKVVQDIFESAVVMISNRMYTITKMFLPAKYKPTKLLQVDNPAFYYRSDVYTDKAALNIWSKVFLVYLPYRAQGCFSPQSRVFHKLLQR